MHYATISPSVPAMNIRRLLDDLLTGQTGAQLDELFTPNPVLARQLEGSGEAFESEVGHGPFSCLDTECGRETCIAFQERILASYPNGFTRCCVCSQTVDNRARLACSSCAS
jgi:hypothetical protein